MWASAISPNVGLPVGPGHLFPGTLVGQWIGPIDDDPLAQRHVLGTGFGERDLGIGPDGDFAFLAVRAVAIDPVCLVLGEDTEVEPSSVAVAAGLDEE
jgi:hypothetical protein